MTTIAEKETEIALRCNRCHRPMLGSSAYDGACSCGGLIELDPERWPRTYPCARGMIFKAAH
jgi:hypothetical protein